MDNKTSEQDYEAFERLAVQFVASLACLVPARLVSLVFASPLCTRMPDTHILWHAGYRKNHRLRLFFSLLLSVAMDFFKGFVKLILNIETFGYALYGSPRGNLLVTTSICSYAAPDGNYKTAYINTEDDDFIFVFGPAGECGKNKKTVKGLPFFKKVALVFALLRCGFLGFFRVKGDVVDKMLLLLQWSSWIVGLQWLYCYYLDDVLPEIIEKNDIKRIGCIHEMHPHSKVIWRLASRYGIECYAVQHASISKGKRWFFPYREEIENGLALPDVFYVFNERVAEALRPYFEGTRFVCGCSCRYSHWVGVKPSTVDKNGYYLFVSALARFDNRVLIRTLDRLLHNGSNGLAIMLRLHPYPELDRGMKRWVLRHVGNNKIRLSSKRSLLTDIEGSAAVVGMSTTVLEEALLMGRPAVQLTHPDYLPYIDIDGIDGSVKVDSIDLTADLLRSIDRRVDRLEMIKRLALDKPLVTYKKLFSEA